MDMSRRELIKGAGIAAMGTGLAGLSLSVASNTANTGEGGKLLELPWPYRKIDPVAAAEAAYLKYYQGACAYGVFDAIIDPQRKEIGHPYTGMPSSLLIVGQGGMADVASVCGCLTGAAAAIFLVTGSMDRKIREASYDIIQDVFRWYEQTELPDFRPTNPKFEIASSPPARSNLCHVSVSQWCKATKFKSFSKERSDRCGWLTASVAKHTAETLNKFADGTFKIAHPLSAAAAECRSCHDKKGTIENSRGVTECGGCHFTPGRLKKHPRV